MSRFRNRGQDRQHRDSDHDDDLHNLHHSSKDSTTTVRTQAMLAICGPHIRHVDNR